MAVGAVSGTKLYINTTVSPDSKTEIGDINNIGDVMTQWAKIAVESIGSGYTKQIKGTLSAPTLSLSLNRNDTDAGQILLKTAASYANRNTLYYFTIVENDIVITATQTYFSGRVYSMGPQYGGVNDLKKIKCDIEIEPDTIVVLQGT